MTKSAIYHITFTNLWTQAREGEFYKPSGFEQDGFIHFCEEQHLEYVRNRYFQGQNDLVILCVDSTLVHAPIRYEDLEGKGVYFPHVYGPLNIDAVFRVVELEDRGRKMTYGN